MKLYEFQGKRLFSEYGIPVPESGLMKSPGDDLPLPTPAVLKSQVLVGGRGKAGGIKVVQNDAEAGRALGELFDMRIGGEPVAAVLMEERASFSSEYYIAFTNDGGRALPLMIASASGGVDIEQVAKEDPEAILTKVVDPFFGPMDYQARRTARELGISDTRALSDLMRKMYKMFTELDATLVEINPLAQTPDGLLALDSKVLLDEKAAFRHGALFGSLMEEQNALSGSNLTLEKEDTTTFVDLDGDIGMISDGAGTGMLTLDLMRDAGGDAATFCEMGGFTNPQVIYDAISVVMARRPKVRALLIVLIGGFNRMDEMAEGIVKYHEDHGIDVPLVVRMVGTLEEVGKETMAQAGLDTFDDLPEAVDEVVRLAKGDS
ncbi:MAG: ATP-grasp domain-containing protein [Clostridia bacterium]